MAEESLPLVDTEEEVDPFPETPESKPISLEIINGLISSSTQFLRNVKELAVGFGEDVFRVDRQGIWLGAAKFEDGPFRVNMQGDLVAASAIITGTIYASSGTIGGFEIGSDYVRDVADSMGLASTVTGGDDIRFWAGDTFANRDIAPFRVTEAGALVAANATITGSITATSGMIGGFEIGSDYVRDIADSMGLASTVTAGDDVRFWAGNTFANRAIAPFRVTEAGVLTATSGTVGGWTMNATTLTGGSAILNSAGVLTLGGGPNVVVLSASDPTYRIWVGDTVAASAPFRVTKTGVLTATGATISGSVTATSGQIGGFDIGSNYIRDAANSMGMASAVTGGDDVRFWAGATFANRANALFWVKESGAMHAESGTIGGTTITSTTLIGGIIRTNNSTTRIELSGSGNTLSFYRAGNPTVTFGDYSGGVIMTGGRFQVPGGIDTSVIITSAYVISDADYPNTGVGNRLIRFDQAGRVQVQTHLDPGSAGTINLGGNIRYWDQVHYVTLVSHTPALIEDKTRGLEILKEIKEDSSGKVDHTRLPAELRVKDSRDPNGQDNLNLQALIMAQQAAILGLEDRIKVLEGA